jgi:polyisoprenyl-phosphate glycosyltransferase
MEKHCIIMPLYNDWPSAAILISNIDQVVSRWNSRITIVIVDDGSQESMPDANELTRACTHIKELLVIRLVCNQGHQRAIAVGLAYAQSRQCFSSVFVMDCDGEDAPKALNDLYDAGLRHPRAIITADRASRSEGPLFRFAYRCYRFLFFLLTGTTIRFGNFCQIPACQLDRMVHYPDLWNSLSGCIKKSGLPMAGTPNHRATRYIGPSKMNIMALILHGLSAISVFKEILMVRLMAAAAVACLLSAFLGILHAGPGPQGISPPLMWGLIFLFSLQFLLILLALTLGRLHHRAHYMPGPAGFWQSYVKDTVSLRHE